jgi:hypothetical protein
MLYLFKWLFLPYLLTVLFAATLGKQQTDLIMGKSLLEEYLFIMMILIIIDTQRIIIKWLSN